MFVPDGLQRHHRGLMGDLFSGDPRFSSEELCGGRRHLRRTVVFVVLWNLCDKPFVVRLHTSKLEKRSRVSFQVVCSRHRRLNRHDSNYWSATITSYLATYASIIIEEWLQKFIPNYDRYSQLMLSHASSGSCM